MEVTYANVKPLIAAEKEFRGMVFLTFKCPSTGMEVNAQHGITASQPARARNVAKEAARNQVRAGISRSILGALGHGWLGSTVVNQVNRQVTSAQAGPKWTRADYEFAVVKAFQLVQDRFAWQNGRWVAVRALEDLRTSFSRDLAETEMNPEEHAPVLGRVLGWIAGVDGSTDQEEADLIESLVGSVEPADELPADDLLKLPPAERERVVMLATAVAWANLDLAESERQALASLQQSAEIAQETLDELDAKAREHVLDQAVESIWQAHGRIPPIERNNLMRTTLKLGFEVSRLSDIERRVRRRHMIP